MEAVLNKEIIVNKVFCRTTGVCIFVILMSLSAFVRIPLPFTPVPLTLQTFFALLSGAFLGNLGFVAQVSYIMLGVLGLPVFTNAGSGLLYLSGPTAGYLFGFVFASYFVSKFIKLGKDNLPILICIFSIGDLIILASGAFWLRFILGGSFSETMLIGFVPFLPGDFLKVLIAAFAYKRLQIRLKEVF